MDNTAATSQADAFLDKLAIRAFLRKAVRDLFPDLQITQSAQMEARPAAPCFSGQHILLVEDNLINQQVAVELLEDVNLHVTGANNGLEAVSLLRDREHPFELVLMDLQMPEMDGYQATRTIRADKAFADMPIIAMTAHAMEGEVERCLKCGMNGHLSKPIDVQMLYWTLKMSEAFSF